MFREPAQIQADIAAANQRLAELHRELPSAIAASAARSRHRAAYERVRAHAEQGHTVVLIGGRRPWYAQDGRLIETVPQDEFDVVEQVFERVVGRADEGPAV